MSLAALLVGGLFAGGSPPPVAVLQAIRWKHSGDTIRLDLRFANGRPAAQRIGPPPGGPLDAPELRIDLEGARFDSVIRRNWPSWMTTVENPSAGTLAVRIRLDGPTPWRAVWDRDALHVDLVDDVRSRSLWTRPVVLGTVGAAAIAGGVALWLGSSEATGRSASPPADDVIPPPDIAFPP